MAKFKRSECVPLSLTQTVSTATKDKRLKELRNSLRPHANSMISNFLSIHNTLAFFAENEGALEDIESAIERLSDCPSVQQILNKSKAEFEQKQRNFHSTKRSAVMYLKNYYSAWVRTKNDFVTYMSAKTFSELSIADLLSPLLNHPHIVTRPRNLAPQMYARDGEIFFVCVLHNLKMTPRKNPYRCINNGGPVAPMPLGKMKVIFNLTNNRTNVETIGSDTQHYRSNGWGHAKKPHPHILGNYAPCLGDFAPPLNEALNSYDIGSALDILCCYLETVDPDDGAGSHWIRWVLPYGVGDYAIRHRFEDKYDRDGYRHEQQADGYFYRIHRNVDEEAARVIPTTSRDRLEPIIQMIAEAAEPPERTEYVPTVRLQDEVDEDHARAMLVAEGETTLDRVAAELAHTMMLAQEAFTEEHEDERGTR